MGDRANVKVVDYGDGPPVYLYTHWMGTELPAILETALQRKQRWDDGPYLARIIFCEMLKASNDLDGERGFGIATNPPDSAYRTLVVDVPKQTVYTADETDATTGEPVAFADFRAELLPEF